MTQLSRPFQIVLVVFVLFAAVWFVALRGHSASGGGAGSSTSSPASPPAAKPAAPSTPYHGSAPGVAGLTRAIEKAHGAVAQSEQNAKRLQEKSAQASGETSSGPAATTPATTSKTGTGAARAVTPKSAATAPKSASSATGAPSASPSKAGGAPSMQATVEGALKRGKLVTVLFWNPKGIVDQVVNRELRSVGHASGGKVAVFAARASQVGSFGSFTKAVQVNETPTIVVVNPRGQATTLVGLTDTFAIEQAIAEVKK